MINSVNNPVPDSEAKKKIFYEYLHYLLENNLSFKTDFYVREDGKTLMFLSFQKINLSIELSIYNESVSNPFLISTDTEPRLVEAYTLEDLITITSKIMELKKGEESYPPRMS